MAELTGELIESGIPPDGLGLRVGGAGVAAWVAWEKGREPVAWFVLAFFLSPLVALVALGPVPAHSMARRRTWRAPRNDRKRPKDPVVAPVRRANGAHPEDRQWDVVTSSATTARKPW